MLGFRILFEDEFMVAVDKPAGFHSHPPEDKTIRLNPRWDALGILQKQLGQKLYPAHRLDRATSGILLFSKKRELNSALHEQFQNRNVSKTYICLVRGNLTGPAILDQSLKAGDLMETALTLVEPLRTFRMPLIGPRGEERFFTMVKACPNTGRYHQIRRHLALHGLPILGDSRHGDKKLNREFSSLTKIQPMLLRCRRLEFLHPTSGKPMNLSARWTRDWHSLFEIQGYCPIL